MINNMMLVIHYANDHRVGFWIQFLKISTNVELFDHTLISKSINFLDI